MQPESLGQFIADIYLYAPRIAGLAVFVMFLWAGLKAFQGGWAAARPIIQDAVIGFILLFSAVLILETINHDLVSQDRSIPSIQRP